ncbi:SDR family oxidoreductase [Pseudonocardia halophobica]|uniref:3-ketoacyl-ACP reductase n=1 Tax=Pseudonocardia halophobica TaxID=29401 RepID=A0A9W6L4T8_9PSEU|nr:SDR family oxidoreductase [Pseudonocardia halophobica]GLL12259.1 3-ketoacyl-ACP reductase [Pseudonocardia halophobica]
MTGELAGRAAIVTGASRGIGLATAAALRARGADVVLTSRRAESVAEAAAGLNATAQAGAGTAVGIVAHASDQAAARACVEEAVERFGRIDVLVNNAGTNPAHGPVTAQDLGRFAKTLEVNLWAPIAWTALVAEAWMGEHGGAVVNTASIGGLVVEPDLGVYNATKAALIHLTRQLAFELAPRVRVNAVAPGVVRTRLAELLWAEHEDRLSAAFPLGRIGEPADVAEAIAFLASDSASWITGQTLVIDGGQGLGDASDREPAGRAGDG